MKIGRTPRTRWFLPSLATFAVIVTSSCTLLEPGSEVDEGGAAGLEEFLDFDEFLPALEFDQTGGAYVQPDPGGSPSSIDIYGPAVVHAGERALTAHDVVNDDPLWSVSTEHGEADSRSALVLEHGETVMAVAAFETVRPGEGTAQDTPMREVLAVDLLSGETLWHNITEAGDGFWGRVIGLDGDSVILAGGGVQAFAADDGSLLWSDDEVTPHLVDGGVVVASSEDADSDIYNFHRLYGIDAETGERVWETWEEGDHETYSHAARAEYSAFLDTDPQPGEMVMEYGSLSGYDVHRVRSAGPGRFYVIASYTKEPWNIEINGGVVALFDSATGVADYSINHDPLTSGVQPRLGWGEASCSYDQEANLACWAEDPGITVVNIDVEAGEALWAEQFSWNSDRRVIEPVSARDGVLYATVEGEPIILDLKDGSDLVLDPGVVPDLTNGTIAVDYVSEDELFRAYPVTG
ncbi:PQQ-binding-like beta-propeller repeat protein [Nocardiopsis sp. NRRL B-16309]|uniref:outer membrane protein assembly factor BamB family protein n=1 Tax=Nocardiopsis sp. NRRL B-16309 TaxID=1519494 RepID=UPI0006B01130|nr:PQQ-binding-like beta-propeller repeat protein [Nocardiopsis sp. NRRL B-16309]KOX16148.1 hypothetical protein ADL05_13205 [Nocardiopsis sp. NRRL B-16309]